MLSCIIHISLHYFKMVVHRFPIMRFCSRQYIYSDPTKQILSLSQTDSYIGVTWSGLWFYNIILLMFEMIVLLSNRADGDGSVFYWEGKTKGLACLGSEWGHLDRRIRSSIWDLWSFNYAWNIQVERYRFEDIICESAAWRCSLNL